MDEVTEFSLPDDLTTLSVEDIQELIDCARCEFNTLNETDDLSDETLDEMTRLADAIDSLHEESQARVELASTKRKSIFSKVFALTDGVELAKKKKALSKRVNKAFPGSAVPFGDKAKDEDEDEDKAEASSEVSVLTSTSSGTSDVKFTLRIDTK